MSVVTWVKTHKLLSIILFVLLYFFVLRPFVDSFFGLSHKSLVVPAIEPSYKRSTYDSMGAPGSSNLDLTSPAESIPESPGRMTVKESSISLVVNDVRNSSEQILLYTRSVGGYMVSAIYNRPDLSPFATITVRVPSDRLDEALKHFASLASKVTNEQLMGTDVTQEYTDIEARLATLRRTKQRFEEIMEKATEVQDIVNVQREIISLQQQIDSYVGMQKALTENIDLSRVTVYLSTDELALPYTPDKTLRPSLVFKEAIRSLLNTIRVIIEFAIWVGVYAVIWVPAFILFLGFRRWRRKHHLKQDMLPQQT